MTLHQKIGEIGIDSGMLLLVDPMYLRSQPIHPNVSVEDTEAHRKKYFDVTNPEYLTQIHTAMGEKSFLQLSDRSAYFERGVGGPAVVEDGHGGDGVFPVYVERDTNGCVLRLVVDFTENALFGEEENT